ncbi:acyl-CoA mutase large subunit family protein [Candidatus Palauibacter sp.]|uniref:acyl-CoA mutase large subunit family protein n=1 Tax=Candidatus Palauibacter sp. TaxID=3101350 RepID=UPI003B02051A
MSERERWARDTRDPYVSKRPERRTRFATSSGIEVEPVYDGEGSGPDTSYPGEFPYTRGVYPTMYRGRPWTMRQYAGFGTAGETNRRFRYLLDSGQTGLSVAFDLPTQMGYDSDDARVRGEVGRVGVAIDSIEDMHRLFEEIPLGTVSTSMTINATAPVLLAMYAAVAEERGVRRSGLRGTVQNDVLKEFIARGTYIYPVEPSLRFVTDVFDFCAAEMPRWRSVSISGYHIREAGATAAQELAFTLANGIEYVRRAVERGLEVDDFAPGLSFFFSADRQFFEETAKFRAARRLWARLMRDRFGASDESCRLRFHAQTGGSTLTAQQPLNNVARVALQALSAVLGGAQSLHANSYDEALSLPSAEAARLALRTQQLLAAETGVADTADPLGGSWFVESLTDALETRAREYIARIEALGGSVAAIDYMQDEIHRAAYRHQRAIESGDLEVVGVNVHDDSAPVETPKPPDYARLEEGQRRRLVQLKAGRDAGDVEASLARIRQTAAGDANLLPVLIDAVRRRVTLGEISHALRAVWGEHRPG